METKKKILYAGGAGIIMLALIVGAASANAGLQGKDEFKGFKRGPGGMGFGFDKMLENLGLGEDATIAQVKAAIAEKKSERQAECEANPEECPRFAENQQKRGQMLEKLGLSADASQEDVKAAMQAQNQQKKEQMLEKLGLSADASQEDVRAAMKALCAENPDECHAKKGFGGRGGFKGFGGGCPFGK